MRIPHCVYVCACDIDLLASDSPLIPLNALTVDRIDQLNASNELIELFISFALREFFV